MSDAEREELAEQGQQQLNVAQRELDEERRARAAERPTGRPRHDGRGWSAY